MKVSIPVNLAEVKEPKPVPVGMYDLVVAGCESGDSQKGMPQLRVSIGILGHEDAMNVTHFVSIPSAKDDADKAKGKAFFLKRFLKAFSIPYEDGPETVFDTDDIPGATAKLELTLSEPDPQTKAVYNRLVLPRLPDEGVAGAGRVAPKPPKR
mgnify:CR=1 FL=1